MVSKAKALRLETGEQDFYAPIEKFEKQTFLKKVEMTVGRPFKILYQEPMLIAITAYMSVGAFFLFVQRMY